MRASEYAEAWGRSSPNPSHFAGAGSQDRAEVNPSFQAPWLHVIPNLKCLSCREEARSHTVGLAMEELLTHPSCSPGDRHRLRLWQTVGNGHEAHF